MAAVTPLRSAEDPFEVLRLEPAFDLNPDELGQRHREISRVLHPDRHVGRPAGERRQALGRAIEVNEAFRILKDPVRRAEALLARLGRPVDEEAAAPSDPDFLMEMMERREHLRSVGRRGDQAGIEALAHEVEAEQSALLEELAREFRSMLARPEEATLQSIARRLGRLRFYRRFFDEVDAYLSG